MNNAFTNTSRLGDWIMTYTGVHFYPLDTRPEEIAVEDIAHALACSNRFTGHTRVPYSIAHHSFLVSYYCSPKDALWGLLHDASEAYLHDIPRPLKGLPLMNHYRILESNLMQDICDKFGLGYEQPESVTIADGRALATEGRDLMPDNDFDWSVYGEPFEQTIDPWNWKICEQRFLERFKELTDGK